MKRCIHETVRSAIAVAGYTFVGCVFMGIIIKMVLFKRTW
jgi:hypothetical protein